mmetsp:Transcript_37743/g.88247  ORF Transcript_37743/g.88247 Transcript_37743/m.88247 type:complete len:149 (-) Transcript_37743:8-454(-)
MVAESSMFHIASSKGASLLQTLDLSDCQHVNDGLIIPLLKACSSLKSLSLSGNRNITDESASALPPNVQRLFLDHCPGITDRSIVVLASRCVRLSDLDLRSNSSVSDTGLNVLLEGATNLERLDIRGCAVSGALTERIKKQVGPIVEG